MTTSNGPHNVLIFGGANTGKTVFVVQLYGRLSAGTCQLELRQQPDDLSLLVEGYDRLNAGIPPEHTTTGANADVSLSLLGPDGEQFDVLYPDYAGEQVDAMVENRQIAEEWRRRVLDAPTWLVFLRLDHVVTPKDVISSPGDPSAVAGDDAVNGIGSVLADQARTVEALQLLLHVAGAAIASPTRNPSLTVVLSCWDELGLQDDARPGDVLRSSLPLVHAFVQANWHPDALRVVGLSAQGKPLRSESPDEEFIDKGPEAMGYIVCPDGSRETDLTLLLSDAIRRTSESHD